MSRSKKCLLTRKRPRAANFMPLTFLAGWKCLIKRACQHIFCIALQSNPLLHYENLLNCQCHCWKLSRTRIVRELICRLNKPWGIFLHFCGNFPTLLWHFLLFIYFFSLWWGINKLQLAVWLEAQWLFLLGRLFQGVQVKRCFSDPDTDPLPCTIKSAVDSPVEA